MKKLLRRAWARLMFEFNVSADLVLSLCDWNLGLLVFGFDVASLRSAFRLLCVYNTDNAVSDTWFHGFALIGWDWEPNQSLEIDFFWFRFEKSYE